MNDALRGFKKASDQVRIRFDARQLVADDVRRLLDQAQPLDNFMRENPLTDAARNDWSTLRANLSVMANAYNVAPSWINNSSSQTGYKGTNRLTGTFKLDSSRSDNPRDNMTGWTSIQQNQPIALWKTREGSSANRRLQNCRV